MSFLVCDIEANGLLEGQGLVPPLDTVWCISTFDLETREAKSYDHEDLPLGLEKLQQADMIVGHNFIGYDIPALNLVYGFTPRPSTTIIDTLVWSRVLNPDRKLPLGCPTHYDSLVYDLKTTLLDESGAAYHPMKPKKRVIGPHSLAAWGWKLGRAKPEHTDWWSYSPEMLHRCEEDVKINTLTLHALIYEADMSIKDLFNWKPFEVEGF